MPQMPSALRRRRQPAISAFLAVAAALGLTVLVIAQAASPFVRFESEAGQLAGCISSVSNSDASGGNALQFNECSDDSSTAGAQLPITYDLSSLSGTIRYAAPDGSNSGSCTVNAPCTLARAISQSSANGSVVVRGGTFRDQRNIGISGKNGLKILAYPGEVPVISGSQTVSSSSGWTNEGNLRYRSYTPRPVADGGGLNFSNTGSMTNLTGDGVGRYPDQAWVGDTPLKEVLNKNQVQDGRFFVDRSNNRLYMTAADVAKGNIETSRPGAGSSDRDRLFQIMSSNVTIEGLRITRFAANANDYGVITLESSAPGFLIRNVDISHLPYHGIFFGNNDNSTIRNVTLTYVGWQTIGANLTDNLMIDSVKVTDSDFFDEFTSSPASGALKTSRTRNTAVINSIIDNNKSHGLWFDQSNINTIVANNIMRHNTGAAIFFEISDGLLFVNNYIRATGSVQALRLVGSSGIRLINNTSIGGANPLGVYTDARSIPGCSTRPTSNPCQISSDIQTRFPIPASMDWMPRIDYMINNIFAYPTGTGGCSTTAACFHTSNGSASAPIQTIIHKADQARGIPQTYVNGNVYANGSNPIIRVNSPAANYSNVSAWTSSMAGSPVAISGIDAESKYGNSWVNSDGSPTTALAAVHNQAVSVPADTEINKYIPAGTRHYGILFEIE